MKYVNLLPYDGEVYYLPSVFSLEESDELLELLLSEIYWQHDTIFMYGKKIVTKREVAWYGDQAFPYTYSKATKVALPWTPALRRIKIQTEAATQETYNSCLLNLYHNGSEGMSWHCDDEKELKKEGAIASVSFGAERRFDFRHKKTKETISVTLASGSILVMKGSIQEHWLHQLPVMKKVKMPRMNLTFRTILDVGL
jgi:alkylated DNA repair dioxygenase AlkB